MTEAEPHLIPRREFLRSAAVVAGTLTLGLEAAAQQASAQSTVSMISAAYWNGHQLVDACHLASGDTSLCKSGVRMRVHGHRGGEALQALNAYFPVSFDGAEQHTPFHAWTGNPERPSGARFMLPVQPSRSILLSALHDGAETFVRLHSDGSPNQPKLRSGLYVLAIGQPHWNICRFEPNALQATGGPLSRRTLSGLQPAEFGYRVISIEPA